MANAIKTLVALDTGVDVEAVRAALPEGQSEIQIVGLVHGLEETWRTLQETTTDLLVVACAGYSDRALFLMDAAVKQRAGAARRRALDAACRTASSSGCSRRAPTTSCCLPEPAERVRFALQKAVARRRGTAAARASSTAPMICVLGPKGGTGKTLTAVEPRRRACAAPVTRRPSSTSTSSSATSGWRSGLAPERTIYDLAQVGRLAGRRQDRGVPGRRTSPERGCCSRRRGPTRPARSRSTSCATSTPRCGARTTSSSSTRRPGFTPEVIAAIDSSTARLHRRACSTRSRSRTRSSGSRRST